MLMFSVQVDNVGSSSGSQPATPTTATPLTTGLSSLPPLPLPSLPPLGLLPNETEHNKDSRGELHINISAISLTPTEAQEVLKSVCQYGTYVVLSIQS